jgi:hypothetical protein
MKTTDGGSSWEDQTAITTMTLFGVNFPVNTWTGYAVGALGSIIKTTDGGASFVEEGEKGNKEQRLEVRLKVTPNPFGELTHISFQLSAPSPVNLNVYNITGQVVKVLVSEPKRAGAYQVAWDGRDERGRTVPAGVYLIRLVAGERKETGRVIKLR